MEREQAAGTNGDIGVIYILGVAVEVAAKFVGALLFCRLDLKMKSLRIYHIDEKGKTGLVKKLPFLVQDID